MQPSQTGSYNQEFIVACHVGTHHIPFSDNISLHQLMCICVRYNRLSMALTKFNCEV